MSLMNYLGAVASAAVEAATAAAIQGQGPLVTNATGTSTNNVNRNEGPAVVSKATTLTSVDGAGRASVAVPQGLPGFPVVPITIHHSSGPSGQIAYAVQAISNGSLRLAHPHVSGAQRTTFTVHPGSVALAGQVPAQFSVATGTPPQQTVEIRLPHSPPTISPQITAPVGSHVVDKQRGVFQVNASFRGPPLPVTNITQASRSLMEQDIRRELTSDSIRLKAPLSNLNTSRPSVLMSPRSNVPQEFIPHPDPAVALSIVLQDHNYTLPKRLSPAPPPPPTISRHQTPPEVSTPAMPIIHRSTSPKLHSTQHFGLHLNPKPSLYGSARDMSPPVNPKARRPRSTSPVIVPARRKRKPFEKKEKDISDFHKKVGVPGTKRTRKHIMEPSVLNNTVPPFPITDVPEPIISSLRLKTNISIPSIESSKRGLKKNKGELPQATRREKTGDMKELEENIQINKRDKLEDLREKLAPSFSVAVEKEEENVASSNKSSINVQVAEDWYNSEGITRCICDYLHDDGFMIACDKCLVWQHVDCMGIDRKDLPDEYLCELCNPRWVSKARARAIQTRKKEMIELGVLDDSTVGDSDQDNGDRFHTVAGPQTQDSSSDAVSPMKSSGKLKRRGRPSLSNGQPFSDSDSEIHSGLHSPTAKRSRKYSGKKGQNLISPDDSPSKIGTRKRKSVEPRTKRSYTRRNTISSPLSSPSMDDTTGEDHQEFSTENGNGLNHLDDGITEDSSGERASHNLSGEEQLKMEDAYSRSSSEGLLANSESRRKRKQIFRDIPNGDISPPHIISSSSPGVSEKQSVTKPRSPSFDRTPGGPVLSNNNSASSSPEPATTISSLHVNVSSSLLNSALLCPYTSSPYLDKYEEAVNSVCSYSPELRAKLLKHHGMGTNSTPDFTPLSSDVKKWKLGVTSLEGGKKLKTLLAAVRVEPGDAVIEFVGKFLMLTAFNPTNKKASQSNLNTITPEPFAFFHQVPKNGMCICIDCRKYGNDARFVRRSCTPNAEIRHIVGKGTIHAYVVATASVDVDEEVTIPHEFKSVTCNSMNSVVQSYNVASPPLPCACSDLETCKAVVPDAAVVDVPHKKNGVLISPTSSSSQETKERKRRMSSRRTSSIDKEPVEIPKTPQAAASPPQVVNNDPKVEAVKGSANTNSTFDEGLDQSPPANSMKDRPDARTTRARTIATSAVSEDVSVSKKKVESVATPRQRNKSGTESNQSAPASSATLFEGHSADSHKMTREERKLQSVLKLIERMESNQKKKESRQNQKKDRSKDKKSDDRETDQDDDSQSAQTPVTLAPIRFAPVGSKKKGRKRGRSSSGKSLNKPQLIHQRNSGSIADLRSTSTESDLNSADEAARAGMSPLQENMGPSFRLPKKKEMMSEWRIGGHPSPTLPSQYMRKMSTNNTTTGATTPPVQSSSGAFTPTNNFLVVPVANGNVDNASAKKRWLRQAISEEIDPSSAPSPNSRPNSPVGVECLAPLKKRRLARASMSSEVSNTPPSTPNNPDVACLEMDAEGENDCEQSMDAKDEGYTDSIEAPTRKWSCSEVSSAEEDLDDCDNFKGENNETDMTNLEGESENSESAEKKDKKIDNLENRRKKSSDGSTPRRSRWDQVDAPEPVTSSAMGSPVKSTEIVLDYVRNPEHYAKLTGATAFDHDKSGGSHIKDSSPAKLDETEVSEKSNLLKSVGKKRSVNNVVIKTSPDESECDLQIHGAGLDSVESSPKTPSQVKKKLSMEEYFKRKMEGKSDEKSAALSNVSTALNIMIGNDSNSSDAFTMSTKEASSPQSDDDPIIRETLQFSSTPTLAERKREELGKRLSKSFGIRVPESDAAMESAHVIEKQSTVTATLPAPACVASPRESVEKSKPNGDVVGNYMRRENVSSSNPSMIGHRLSVPTPAALKQSGMPPLPPHLSPSPLAPNSGVTNTPNGATKLTLSTTPNGYVPNSTSSAPQSGSSYRNYRGASNGPSSYQQNRILLTAGPSNQSGVSSSTSGPIIGGVPVGNLIPPPPPPTTQGTAGPAFGKGFYNKKFFPSS